jgi:hypothetical protein
LLSRSDEEHSSAVRSRHWVSVLSAFASDSDLQRIPSVTTDPEDCGDVGELRRAIHRDVERTGLGSTESAFLPDGQATYVLEDSLTSFAERYPSIRYYQGFNCLAAILYKFTCLEHSVPDVSNDFQRSLDGLLLFMARFYVDGFDGLHAFVKHATFEASRRYAPNLVETLDANGLSLLLPLTPWVLTLFSSTPLGATGSIAVLWDLILPGDLLRDKEARSCSYTTLLCCVLVFLQMAEARLPPTSAGVEDVLKLLALGYEANESIFEGFQVEEFLQQLHAIHLSPAFDRRQHKRRRSLSGSLVDILSTSSPLTCSVDCTRTADVLLPCISPFTETSSTEVCTHVHDAEEGVEL